MLRNVSRWKYFFLRIAQLCSCPCLDDDDDDADMMMVVMLSPQKYPAVQLPWLGLPQQNAETSSDYVRGFSPYTGVTSVSNLGRTVNLLNIRDIEMFMTFVIRRLKPRNAETIF